MPKINKCQEIWKKIEKPNEIYIQMKPPNSLKGHPIIAGRNSPTQRLSFLLEKILTALVSKPKYHIKDDWESLNIKDDWESLKKLPRNLDLNFTFLTCDIVWLCTDISHELGLRALLYYITKCRNLIPIRFRKKLTLEAVGFC